MDNALEIDENALEKADQQFFDGILIDLCTKRTQQLVNDWSRIYGAWSLTNIPKIGFGLGTKWFNGNNHNTDGSSLVQEGNPW